MELKIILAVMLIFFQLIDVALTEKILKAGGVELNLIIKRYGYWVKIPASVFAIAMGFIFNPIIIIPPLIIMCGVCIYNYTVFRKIQ